MPAAPKTPEEYALLLKRFSYVVACLNKINPTEGDKAKKRIAQNYVADLKRVHESALGSLGLKRVQTREDKQAAYDQRDEMRWGYQYDTLPKHYAEQVVEAFELGCVLPAWAMQDAIRLGASVEKRAASVQERQKALVLA